MPSDLTVLTGILADYDSLPLKSGMRPMCSWPLDTIEARARLHQAIVGANETLWLLCKGRPYIFEVTDMAAHFCEYPNPEKPEENISTVMLTFLGPAGNVHTGSGWVYKAMQQLAWIEGPPPWYPPIVLKAERLPTSPTKDRMAVTLVGRASS